MKKNLLIIVILLVFSGIGLLLAANQGYFGYGVSSTSLRATLNSSSATISTSVSKVEEWGVCKTVTSTDARLLFIPTKTSGERTGFITNKPSHITLGECGCRTNADCNTGEICSGYVAPVSATSSYCGGIYGFIDYYNNGTCGGTDGLDMTYGVTQQHNPYIGLAVSTYTCYISLRASGGAWSSYSDWYSVCTGTSHSTCTSKTYTHTRYNSSSSCPGTISTSSNYTCGWSANSIQCNSDQLRTESSCNSALPHPDGHGGCSWVQGQAAQPEVMGTCVLTQTHTCAAKPSVGTVWNTVSSYTQTWNGTAWSPVATSTTYNTTASTTSCRYKCATNYTWNGTSCVANTRTYTCAAKPSIGTLWNTVSSYTQTWNGTAWSPIDSTTTYNTTSSTTSCRYRCDIGYTWNGTSCVADSGGGGCFTEGTQILLFDSTKKSIEEIQIGDSILGVNGKEGIVEELFKIWNDNRDIYSINNSDYFVTDSHPFLTVEGWKSLNPLLSSKESPGMFFGKMGIGDILITKDKATILYSIKKKSYKGYVYSFRLDDNKTYYADGFAVHNQDEKVRETQL